MIDPSSFDFIHSFPKCAENLYASLQNCIVQEGSLEEFALLKRIYEMILTLQNMGEMHLLNAAEEENLRRALTNLEKEAVRCDRDLKVRLEETEKELKEILSSFQNGSTRSKIIFLLSRLPDLLFRQEEETSASLKKAFVAKIAPLQKMLSSMSPLELSRFQRRLSLIEETFQKRVPQISEKELDHFLKNLAS